MKHIIKSKINFADVKENDYILDLPQDVEDDLEKYGILENVITWKFYDLPNNITEFFEYQTQDDSYMLEAIKQSFLYVVIELDENDNEVKDVTFWIDRE